MAASKAKSELVAAYIGALGLSAIRVLGERGQCWIELEPEALPEVADDTSIERFWFAKAQHAELVLMNCSDDFRNMGAIGTDGGLDLSITVVRDHVVNVASGLGAEWRTTAEVFKNAEEVAGEIEKNVEALNKTGALRPLNARYKAYRFAMMGSGKSAINYSAYLQFFKLRVAKLIGQNVAAGVGRYEGFSAIIPSLVVEMDGAVHSLPKLRNTTRPRVEKFGDTLSGMTSRRSNKMRMLKV